MAKFCFVCLNLEDNVPNITEPNSSNANFIYKLKTCIPDIDWKNNLQICLKCSVQLENAYKFRELCIKLKDARYAAWDDLENSKIKNQNSQPILSTENVIAEKIYICLHCEKDFSSKTVIARHIETEHKNFKDINCINCNKKYTNEILCKEHQDTCFLLPEQQKKDCNIEKKLFKWDDLETSTVKDEKSQCIVSAENVIVKKIFICLHCDKNFSRKTFLSRHIKAEHKRFKDINCRNCNEKYTNDILWKEHQDSCSFVQEQGKEECNSTRDLKIVNNHELCIQLEDSKHSSSDDLENPKTKDKNSQCIVSTKNVIDETIYICCYCEKNFSSAAFLARHVKTEHNKFKDVNCINCYKKYTTEILLKEHQDTCFSLPEKEKKHCSSDTDLKTVEKQAISVNHEKTQNQTDVKNKCDICGASFNNKYLLKRHKKNVHATEKNFKCNICPSSFVSPVYLNAHKKYHSGDRKHVCLFCGKRYITASDLYHHEKIHANKRAYGCPECNKAFNTSSDLHKHKICVHMDRNLWKYSCGYCKRRFPLKTNLDTHIKTHTGERNFSCHLCDKKCISRSALTRHIDSHTNVQSFKCTICDSGYKYQKSLHIHMFKNHGIGNVKLPERVKKYFCHVCPRSYYANSKLQKHLRTHSGDKPFKCPSCDKCFIDKSYVKQHLKVVHNFTDN